MLKNEDVHSTHPSTIFLASPMLSGEYNKYLDDTDDTFNNGKEVTPITYEPSNTHE